MSDRTGRLGASVYDTTPPVDAPGLVVRAADDRFTTGFWTFTATAAGASIDRSTSPVSFFSVVVKGTGAAPTSWTVALEVSLDPSLGWTTLFTHTETTPGNGLIAYPANAIPHPVTYFRANCTALDLGSATDIVVRALARA